MGRYCCERILVCGSLLVYAQAIEHAFLRVVPRHVVGKADRGVSWDVRAGCIVRVRHAGMVIVPL